MTNREQAAEAWRRAVLDLVRLHAGAALAVHPVDGVTVPATGTGAPGTRYAGRPVGPAVFDAAPAGALLPHVRCGPFSFPRTDTVEGAGVAPRGQLDVFAAGPGLDVLLPVTAAVVGALDGRQVSITHGGRAVDVEIRAETIDARPDPDDVTMHGVVIVEGEIYA